MRSARLMRLLIINLVVLAMWVQPSSADNRTVKRLTPAGKGRTPSEGKERQWEKKVQGEDKDQDVAEQVALNRAREALGDYLATQSPRIARASSIITEDYVREHLLVKKPERIEPTSERGYVCLMELKVGTKEYNAMLAEDRRLADQERLVLVHDRMLTVGKFLAGLVVLFGVVAGYFRLEEATKGYYTTLLRIAAASFVCAVGAALLLIA